MASDARDRVLACLDEIEALAKATGGGAWRTGRPHSEPGRVVAADGHGICWDVPDDDDARHIAVHDPDAVLRWVAGLRRLAGRHAPVHRLRPGLVCVVCAKPDPYVGDLEGGDWPCDDIRDLAEALGVGE